MFTTSRVLRFHCETSETDGRVARSTKDVSIGKDPQCMLDLTCTEPLEFAENVVAHQSLLISEVI